MTSVGYSTHSAKIPNLKTKRCYDIAGNEYFKMQFSFLRTKNPAECVKVVLSLDTVRFGFDVCESLQTMILEIKINEVWHSLKRKLLPYTKDGLRDPAFWQKTHKFSLKIESDGFYSIQIDDEVIAGQMLDKEIFQL